VSGSKVTRDCCLRAGAAASAGGYWVELVQKLYESNPARFLTEAEGDDVQNVSKVLGAVCVFDEAARLFSADAKCAEQLKAVAQAVMAEAVSRSVS
jgi:hypothetical protein